MNDIRRACLSLLVALAVPVVCGPVRQVAAQSPAPEKRFDVASVKPAVSPAESLGFGMRTMPGGRFQALSVTLKQLVAEAFEVKDYQLDGGPKWLTTDFFSINASAGGEATKDEIHVMLKALLADRFALKTRLETRQAAVYALSLARSDGRLGPGLKPTSAECLAQIEAQRKQRATSSQPPPPPPRLDPRGLPMTPICGRSMTSNGPNGAMMLYSATEIKSLVSIVSGELAGPAVDRTGLTGPFDVVLQFTSERLGGRRGLDPNSNDTPAPPLPIAFEKQLGLKVEKQLGPLPIVVIDSAGHPTAD
jgi:bla regulator protein BlaR1